MSVRDDSRIRSGVRRALGREVNDREFRIIVPKNDNSGRPIKSEKIEAVAKRMSRRFGGVTVFPSVAGCFIPDSGEREGELMCEENVIITSVRDSEDAVRFSEDERFMREIAGDVGVELGQVAVMVSEDVVEADFIEGRYLETVSEDNIGRNVFERLL